MISSNKYDTVVKHVGTDILGIGYFEDEVLDEQKKKLWNLPHIMRTKKPVLP